MKKAIWPLGLALVLAVAGCGNTSKAPQVETQEPTDSGASALSDDLATKMCQAEADRSGMYPKTVQFDDPEVTHAEDGITNVTRTGKDSGDWDREIDAEFGWLCGAQPRDGGYLVIWKETHGEEDLEMKHAQYDTQGNFQHEVTPD